MKLSFSKLIFRKAVLHFFLVDGVKRPPKTSLFRKTKINR